MGQPFHCTGRQAPLRGFWKAALCIGSRRVVGKAKRTDPVTQGTWHFPPMGNHCHEAFPGIQFQSLGTRNPGVHQEHTNPSLYCFPVPQVSKAKLSLECSCHRHQGSSLAFWILNPSPLHDEPQLKMLEEIWTRVPVGVRYILLGKGNTLKSYFIKMEFHP